MMLAAVVLASHVLGYATVWGSISSDQYFFEKQTKKNKPNKVAVSEIFAGGPCKKVADMRIKAPITAARVPLRMLRIGRHVQDLPAVD